MFSSPLLTRPLLFALDPSPKKYLSSRRLYKLKWTRCSCGSFIEIYNPSYSECLIFSQPSNRATIPEQSVFTVRKVTCSGRFTPKTYVLSFCLSAGQHKTYWSQALPNRIMFAFLSYLRLAAK